MSGQYARCKYLAHVPKILGFLFGKTKMKKEELKPDVVTWTTLISTFGQNGGATQAMELFDR